MCLAIYKPATTKPDWSAYQNGHWSNDDSWGFAAVVDGKIVTRCGVGKFAEFREAFQPYWDKQAIIHFRLATHGATDEANCHPFMVADDLAVIHNGIISIQCDVNKAMSDTWHFNELVLRPMHKRDPDFYSRPEIVYTQELAHSGSKFVFLRADGDYHIWNAGDGEWADDGHWYSNSSHTYCRFRYYPIPNSVPQTLIERPAVTVDSDKWWRVEEDESLSATAVFGEEDEAERETAAFNDMRITDLRAYGFSSECLEEVFELLGHYGIEALHDAI